MGGRHGAAGRAAKKDSLAFFPKQLVIDRASRTSEAGFPRDARRARSHGRSPISSSISWGAEYPDLTGRVPRERHDRTCLALLQRDVTGFDLLRRTNRCAVNAFRGRVVDACLPAR